MKNGKDFSKKGKNKGAGGGEKAGNSKKQSYKQVGIKKKRYVGMPNTYMLQTVTQIFNNVCYPA